MLDLDRLCNDFESCIGWPYVSPGSNSANGIDCSGMFDRAYKLQGGKIYHGSNTIWRDGSLSSKIVLTNTSQLRRGMAVFKWKAWDPSSAADRRNKYFGDAEGNLCHIGLVTSVNPLRIVHASTEGMKVKVDTSLGRWKRGGLLRDVDYGSYISPQTTQTTAPLVVSSVYPTLRRGARGVDVTMLQNALLAKGYVIEVDGIFGKATRAAVVQYQAAHGLVPDGIVGRLTWAALGVT